MGNKISNLWSDITLKLFQKIDENFIDTFRIPGGANSRLAAWDPYDRSMRYYKFLLFNAASSKPKEFFDAYKSLGNVNIGQPVSVHISGCDINIDHLFAIEEALFIRENHKGDLKSIVEIGAGFGRTCQALLSLMPEIESYSIIDLPEVLNLSRQYLRRAIPDFFHKVRFIDCNSESYGLAYIDLAINIDSFQEMPPETIDQYMKGVISDCQAFYCKNPTGKYFPDNVGLINVGAEQLKDVYSLGHCREIFDLFNQSELERAAKKYLISYLPPSKGSEDYWGLVADEPMKMFPYFHHALYLKANLYR